MRMLFTTILILTATVVITVDSTTKTKLTPKAISASIKDYTGKTVKIELAPNSVIVFNGIITLKGRDSGRVIAQVPGKLKTKIQGLKSGTFYRFTIKISGIDNAGNVKGMILTCGG